MKGKLHLFEEFVLTRSIAFHTQRLQLFSEFGSLDGYTMWSDKLDAEVGMAVNQKSLHVALKEFVVVNREVLHVHCCGKAGERLFIAGVACKVFEHS